MWRRMVIGTLLLVALYLGRTIWLPPIASWLDVSQPRLPVDVAIPLPGGNDDRPFAVAALVRSGLAQQAGVLVNEMTPNVIHGVVAPMHEVTREVLVRRGVAAEDILMLEGTSNSTFSDVQIIGELLRQRPNATIAIVTAPSHTRRVRWTVDQILPSCRGQVCVIATYNDTYDERIWWRSEQGLQATVSEYLKLVFYWLKYSSTRQRAVLLGIILLAVMAIVLRVRKQRLSNPAAEAAASG